MQHQKTLEVSDLPRYRYKIIVFANLSSDRLLQRLFGSYDKEIFNYEKTYSELVFPVCSSTYYKNQRIVISMDIEGKIEEVNETTLPIVELTMIKHHAILY